MLPFFGRSKGLGIHISPVRIVSDPKVTQRQGSVRCGSSTPGQRPLKN
jgi:hypothetical protein